MKKYAVIQIELWLPTSDTMMKMIPFFLLWPQIHICPSS